MMSEDLCNLSITGRLGHDPETKTVGQGTVLRFSIAVNTRRKTDGEWGDVANWYSVDVWGKRGDALGRLLHRGDRVAVAGRLFAREYDGRNGHATALEITADSVVLLGSPRGAPAHEDRQAPRDTAGTQGTTADGPEDGEFSSDDIPF